MKYLLLLFLATIGINWPELPYNARLADVIFIPLAAAVCFSAFRTPHSPLRTPHSPLRTPHSQLPTPHSPLTWRWFDVAVAVYLLGAVPAILISTDRQESAIEFLRQLYLVAIYVVFAIAARRGFAKTTATGLALGGALLAATGLVFVTLQLVGAAPAPLMGEVMQLPYIGDALRLRALTASEAMLACVLTAAAPFAIALCRSERVGLWCVAAGLMMTAAVLTFSHAVAGFAVAVLIAAWPSLGTRPLFRRTAIAAVAVVVTVLNFAATVSVKSVTYGGAGYADRSQYHHAVDQQETRIGGAAVIYNVMSYARIKQVAWRAFLEHPVAGIGLDRFHVATARAHAEGALPVLYREIDPHSTLLGRLAECGIIGGITLLMLWGSWAVMAREVLRGGSAVGYAAAAAIAGLIVSSLNADIMNFRFVWVLAGLLRGLQEANGIVTASARAATTGEGTR